MPVSLSRRHFLKSSAAAALVIGSGKYGLARTRHADEFVDYDATGLADLIRAGDINQAELVEVVIRRIEALDPILNFMTTPAFERAREMAGTIPDDTTFAGVPILIKDMVDVAGLRRTDGSRLLATNVPERNVAFIDGVEAAGLNIIGMTNVPEFAGGFTTNNNLFGETLNPWNLAYSPYVSSGGAAAAAAAGVLPLVHGTDGAGSNRLPASTCGLFGMKPSRFRMLSGEAGGGHDRTKTNQAMSRTVRDSARLMTFTEDASDSPYEPVGLVEGPSSRRLRIGFVTDAPGVVDVTEEVQAAQTRVAEMLEDMGHTVVEAEWPGDSVAFAELWPLYFATRMVPLKAQVEALTGVPVTEADMLTGFQASFAAAAAKVPPEDSARAEEFIESLPARFEQAFTDIDMMLCPVMPKSGALTTDFDPNETFSPARIFSLLGNLKFTGPVNFAGNPAMSVPLTWNSSAGLPIGSQFIAPVGADRSLYELAYELEEARPWKDIWAPISVKNIPV
ncbi:MAG: amidase [Hyphomicrobiales bacterium]|nr:amidase [Hyphomicrobiales bacterium]